LADASTVDCAPFDDETLRAFYTYWGALACPERPPRRADLDPLAMPAAVLPHLLITQRETDGGERVRLVGTHLVAHLGFDPTGRCLHAMAGDGHFADVCLHLLAALYADGTSIHAGGHHETGLGAIRVGRHLMCPLSDGGTMANASVSCVVFRATSTAQTVGDGGLTHVEFVEKLPV